MPSIELNHRLQAAIPPAVRVPAMRRFPVEAGLLVLLVATAFLVRIWPLWQVHFWDEAVYLQNAEVICCAKTNYTELDSRPPLLSLIFAAIFLLWHNVYAASIVTAALNAVGPLFLYLSGRRLIGRTAAAIAALLLAFSPFFVSGGVGNSLLTDSPALTLILICFWMLVKAGADDAEAWFTFAGFVGALAVLMRFASLPTIAVLSLLSLRTNRRFGAAIRFAVGFVVGLGPYLLWSRLRYGGFLTTLRHGWENVGGSVQGKLYYLQNFATVFSWMTVAGLVLWLVVRVFRIAVKSERRQDSLFRGAGEQDSRGWDLFLWAWVLIVLTYFTALPHKELRYILPLAPPLLMLAGRGLVQLVRFHNLAARAIGGAVLVVALGYTFAPILGRFHGPLISPFISEEKEVTDYLNRIAPRSAVLYANINYPVFGYYTRLTTRTVLEQDAGFYRVFPNNMPADGYLILYRDVDKDPRMDWVESNAHFRRVEEFPGLIVYEYSVKPH